MYKRQILPYLYAEGYQVVTVSDLAKRILLRECGIVKRDFMVPRENSSLTILPAIMIIKDVYKRPV